MLYLLGLKLLAEIGPAKNKVHVFSRDVLLAYVNNVITNFSHNDGRNPNPLVILSFKTKSFSKNNTYILALRSDKGNVITKS